MVQVLIDNVTYYLLQYITCYYGSFNAPWQKSKCSLLVGIRRLSRCALWRNILRFFKQFCWVLVPKSPVLIYPNLHCSFMQPHAAGSNYTASWDDTGRPWAAHGMTLYWWRKSSMPLCTLLLSSNRMHTNYCGTYISWMPSEWGFLRLYFC